MIDHLEPSLSEVLKNIWKQKKEVRSMTGPLLGFENLN